MSYDYCDISGEVRSFTIGDDNYTSLASVELCDHGVIQDIIDVWFIYQKRSSRCALPVGNPKAKIRRTTVNRTIILRSFRDACNGRTTCSSDLPLYTGTKKRLYSAHSTFQASLECASMTCHVNYNRVYYTCPGTVASKQQKYPGSLHSPYRESTLSRQVVFHHRD